MRCAACRHKTSRCRQEIARCRPLSRGDDRRHAQCRRDCWRSAASRMIRRCARSAASSRAIPSRMARAIASSLAAQPQPLRQLSLLALQHEHRRADAADVSRRLRVRSAQIARRSGRGRRIGHEFEKRAVRIAEIDARSHRLWRRASRPDQVQWATPCFRKCAMVPQPTSPAIRSRDRCRPVPTGFCAPRAFGTMPGPWQFKRKSPNL